MRNLTKSQNGCAVVFPGFWNNANAWESWLVANSPATERFVYLIDESSNYAQTQQWADWMKTNPGVARASSPWRR
jgi:hypothetical protein